MLKTIMSLCLFAVNSYAYMQADLNAILDELVSAKKFSGSITIFDHSGVIYRDSKGFADAKATKHLKENDVFKIGSMTKEFTAYLVLDSIVRGELKLDSRIGDFLPSPEAIKNIKIESILNHTAGLSNQSVYEMYEKTPCSQAKEQDLKSWLYSVSIDGNKVGHFNYSNAGYSILACILERKTKSRLDLILKKRIFEPLNMKSSGVAWNLKKTQSLVDGLDDFGNKVEFNTARYFGAGDIISNEADLIKWQRFLMNSKIFSSMIQNLVPGKDSWKYGFGVIQDTYNNKPYFWVNGNTPGFVSELAWLPERQIGVLILSNRKDFKVRETNQRPVVVKIFDTMTGVQPTLQFPLLVR